MKAWLRARLREKSTWLGLVLVGGSVLAGPLGFAYADLKDAALVFFGGLGLAATPTGGGAE